MRTALAVATDQHRGGAGNYRADAPERDRVADQPPGLHVGQPLAKGHAQSGCFTLGARGTLRGGLAGLREAFLLALAGRFDLREASGGVGIVLRRLLVLAGGRLSLRRLGLPVLVGLIDRGLVGGRGQFVICHEEIVAGQQGRV